MFILSIIYCVSLLLFDITFYKEAHKAKEDINKKKEMIEECDKESKEFAKIDCLKKIYKDFPALQQSLEKDSAVDKKVLLFEYHRTQEMLIHYDKLSWFIGSILVGSNIMALGFISGVSNPNPSILFVVALGGSILSFTWVMWFYRHASIYNVKNDRLYMIENQLGMFQHRMVGYGDKYGLITKMPGREATFLLFVGLLAIWFLVALYAAFNLPMDMATLLGAPASFVVYTILFSCIRKVSKSRFEKPEEH